MYAYRHFKDETTIEFSQTSVFSLKPTRQLPAGLPNLAVFLSELEKEVFKISPENSSYNNTFREEWEAIRSFVDDRRIVMKKIYEGSYVVICNSTDYLLEAERKLNDSNAHNDVPFKEKLLANLVDKKQQHVS